MPKALAFPEGVHEVEIVKIGNSRIVSPVGQVWDEYFSQGPRASKDFMRKRTQPKPATRRKL
jgi:antitoxin VapB